MRETPSKAGSFEREASIQKFDTATGVRFQGGFVPSYLFGRGPMGGDQAKGLSGENGAQTRTGPSEVCKQGARLRNLCRVWVALGRSGGCAPETETTTGTKDEVGRPCGGAGAIGGGKRKILTNGSKAKAGGTYCAQEARRENSRAGRDPTCRGRGRAVNKSNFEANAALSSSPGMTRGMC